MKAIDRGPVRWLNHAVHNGLPLACPVGVPLRRTKYVHTRQSDSAWNAR